MPRPLFKKSIAELEAMFWASQGLPEQLQLMAEELAHRKTPRAVALREQVLLALKSSSATNAPGDAEAAPDVSLTEDAPALLPQ